MLSESQYVWRRADSSICENEFIVGIDFGTTNSCAAIWNPYKKRAKVIKNFNSTRLTRSTIKFDQDFVDPIIGVAEIDELCSTQVLSRLKLLLGSLDRHDAVDVGCTNMKGEHCEISVENLCSFILSYIRKYSEAYIIKNMNQFKSLGHSRHLPLKSAVIGIPVSFSTIQVDALRKAAVLAGFKNVYFMSESTAAAMSYGLLVAGDKIVVIFDMGGGTTDVTILRIVEGTSHVLATAGNGHCGGSNFDSLIVKHLLGRISDTYLSMSDGAKVDDAVIDNLIKQHGAVVYGHLLAICSNAKVRGSISTTCNILKY